MKPPPLDRRSFLRSVTALAGLSVLPRAARAAEKAAARTGDPANLAEIFSLQDAEALAQTLIPASAFTYIQSGAGAEITLRWNQERFDDIRLHQRVLADLGALDTGTKLLGRHLAMPLLFAPTGLNQIAHPEGELAVARGAGATGTTYILSTGASTSIEDVKKAATEPVWFQLYIQVDPQFTRDLLRRAEAAGVEALCVTVDAPVAGNRNRSERARFRLPPGMREPHLEGVKQRDSVANLEEVIPVRQVWRDIADLISFARRPVFLKGIMHPADAAMAVKVGAAGIIVSNHGARNLDTQPATIEALPAVAAAVEGRIPVLLDGGVRRGTDIVKALALGATAVLIGRPYLYGLAAGGATGVAHIQRILRKELRMAMALLGRPNLASIDRSVIWTGRDRGQP
jgi:4-hydroxymandelate oxidase